MKVHNATRGITLAENARKADTFVRRLRGLMFTRTFPAAGALVLLPCNSVHTFGMKYPIDVVFVDMQGKVLRTCHTLYPGRFSPVISGARAAIELPAGTIARSGTKAGDLLLLEKEQEGGPV